MLNNGFRFFAQICIVSLGLLVPVLGQAQNNTLDSIVAIVEEDVILRSELDLMLLGIRRQIESRGGGMPPTDLLEKQVLDRMVVNKLQIQRALATGIRISDADIDQTLTRLAQQNNISIQQMRDSIELTGQDFAEFRRELGENMMIERLRQRVVRAMNPISETEIDILLASEELAGGEYNLSHIVINMPQNPTQEQIREATEKTQDVYQRIQGGLDFASAAISYSNSPDALEGGVIGWRDLNSIPAFFADRIRNMQIGDISEPMRSPAGYHILKVNDRRERGQVVVEEYNAKHLMIETNELVTPRMAMEKINELKQQLDAGESFDTLAKEHSDDHTSANLGGDMGWFPSNAYGARVQQTIDSMQPGQISEPFQSATGWHIVQYLGSRQTDKTDEAIRNEARERIQMRKAEEEVEQFVRQMRDEAYIELRLAAAGE